ESKMHHVSFTYDVFLALEAQLAHIARARFAASRDVVIERDDFGTNETVLEVGMDYACGLRCSRARTHCPGADFLGPRGEKRLHAQQPVRAADHPVEAGLLES